MLRFLFIIALVYLLFKLFARYALPYLLRMFVRKAQRDFSKHQHEPKGKEGNINIHQQEPKSKAKKKDKSGDYIDFEEVENE